MRGLSVDGGNAAQPLNSSSPVPAGQSAPESFSPLFAGESDGLLEQTTLRLLPGEDAGRRLLHGDRGPVGDARWTGSGWWRGWPVLEVREVFDTPLVFTVCRTGLLPRWQVCEAEGDCVGYLGRSAVFDRWGRIVLTRQVTAGQGLLRDALDRSDLARWTRGEAGVTLTFLPLARHDPYVKMMLLAAVLLWEP